MSAYFETFRSNVFPWETDVVEHFTVACYYEKFAIAGDRALLALGQCHDIADDPRLRDEVTRLMQSISNQLN